MIKVIVMCLAGLANASEMNVTGKGTVSVQPDEGYISVGVVTKAETTVKALAQNTEKMQQLFLALFSLNIDKKDVQTRNFNVSQVWKYEKDKERVPDGFTVSNMVVVKVRNLDNIGKVLDIVVQEGANRVGSISFGSSKLEEKRIEARKLAVENAFQKATTIGRQFWERGVYFTFDSSNITINESSSRSYLRSPMRAESAMGKAVPIAPGTLEVTVQVNIRFGLRAVNATRPRHPGDPVGVPPFFSPKPPFQKLGTKAKGK